LTTPIAITNTHQVGIVRDTIVDYVCQHHPGVRWLLPVVAETYDGWLNDINGFHVTRDHVLAAIAAAAPGPVPEGNVGGGTGMICHEFKCGIGTASRRARIASRDYTVGVLVQANYGLRDTLRIAGVPVGQHLREHRVYSEPDPQAGETGSIIIVVGTDAPLLPHQLERIARRTTLGLARMGSTDDNGSGDIFVAFSTVDIKSSASKEDPAVTVPFLPNHELDRLFAATVFATEEAIVNAMVAARDMQGNGGKYAKAIPHAERRKVLQKYGRLIESR
jgi:D-aminopeptidase